MIKKRINRMVIKFYSRRNLLHKRIIKIKRISPKRSPNKSQARLNKKNLKNLSHQSNLKRSPKRKLKKNLKRSLKKINLKTQPQKRKIVHRTRIISLQNSLKISLNQLLRLRRRSRPSRRRRLARLVPERL